MAQRTGWYAFSTLDLNIGSEYDIRHGARDFIDKLSKHTGSRRAIEYLIGYLVARRLQVPFESGSPLLYGSSRTGKTSIIKFLAELHVNYKIVSWDEFDRLCLGSTTETSDTGHLSYDVLVVDDVRSPQDLIDRFKRDEKDKQPKRGQTGQPFDDERLYMNDTSSLRAKYKQRRLRVCGPAIVFTSNHPLSPLVAHALQRRIFRLDPKN